jgi:hypothetical protein
MGQGSLAITPHPLTIRAWIAVINSRGNNLMARKAKPYEHCARNLKNEVTSIIRWSVQPINHLRDSTNPVDAYEALCRLENHLQNILKRVDAVKANVVYPALERALEK